MKAKYIAKSSESTAKGILYSIHFIWGCTILYKTDWLPWYQLGNGLFANQIKNLPFTDVPYDVHIYSISFSGYYAFQLIDLAIFGRDRVDFHEMMAHHIASTSLVCCMIIGNAEPPGIIMAWQQTLCDIFVSISRVLASTHYAKATEVVYYIMMVLWMYTRVGTLGYTIFLVATEMRYPPEMVGMNIHIGMYVFYLSCLYIMQIYWTFLLIAMIQNYNKTGQNNDLQFQVKEAKK